MNFRYLIKLLGRSVCVMPLLMRLIIITTLCLGPVSYAKDDLSQGVGNDGQTTKNYTPDQAQKQFLRLWNRETLGELDPFILRGDEVRETENTLRSGKSVYLIGEAGTGKSALVEYWATMTKSGFEVWSLDYEAFVGGTSFRGDLEGRLKAIMSFVMQKPNRILVIDEIHRIMAQEAISQGIKGPMAREPGRGGQLVIGMTTKTEFRKHIEPDTALRSRGAEITLDNYTHEQLLRILQSRKLQRQTRFGVDITSQALDRVATLVLRHFRSEPASRKVIEFMDGVMVRRSIELQEGSDTLHKVRNELSGLLPALEATRDDMRILPNDISLRREVERLETDVRNRQEHVRVLEDANTNVAKVQNDIAHLNATIDDLKRQGAFKNASRITQLEAERSAANERLTRLEQSRVSKVITPADVDVFVAGRLNMKPEFLRMTPNQRLTHIETELPKMIVNQDHLVRPITDAISGRILKVSDRPGPVGVYLLVGSTGIGKTYISETVSRTFFGEGRLVRLDMTEYSEPHSISRITTAPPSYLGHGEPGSLEPLRRNPHQGVLLDEIEKADRAVRQALITAMSEGKITDGSNHEIPLVDSLMFMTTNAAKDYAFDRDSLIRGRITLADLEIKYAQFGVNPGELRAMGDYNMSVYDSSGKLDQDLVKARDSIRQAIDQTVVRKVLIKQQIFSAEFLNRVQILVPNLITVPMAIRIANRYLNNQKEYIKRETGLVVKFDRNVARVIGMAGWDQEYGARPIMQKREDYVTRLITSTLRAHENLPPGSEILLRVANPGEAFDPSSNREYVLQASVRAANPSGDGTLAAEQNTGLFERVSVRRTTIQQSVAESAPPAMAADALMDIDSALRATGLVRDGKTENPIPHTEPSTLRPGATPRRR